MKAWKENLIADILNEMEVSRIVSLREIANRSGINHISAGDVRDIMNAVEKKMPDDYRAVQIVASAKSKESLFCSLSWIDNTVEFDDGEEYNDD